MAALTSGSKPLKEYLKRYESKNEEEKRKKTKKKKSKPVATGVLLVDEDPVWKKPVNLEEDNEDEYADEDKPQVDEDIEAQRVRMLEQLIARRDYNAISEDGSGWVSLSPKRKDTGEQNVDISPPRRQRAWNDTPTPERKDTVDQNIDISPPRRQRARNDTPSPEQKDAGDKNIDISPPRRQRARNDTPSLERKDTGDQNIDISPPRRQRARNDSPSPEQKSKHSREDLNLSPPWQQCKPDLKSLQYTGSKDDLSPHRRRRDRNSNPEPELMPARQDKDLSPPRQPRKRALEIHERKKPEHVAEFSHHQQGLYVDDAGKADLSHPRKSRNLSPQHSHRRSLEDDTSRASFLEDLSPPRKNHKENLGPASSRAQQKTGLVTGRDIREEISKSKKEDLLRFEQMDPSISGRGAEPVFRDKKGERISKDEFLKSKQKLEEKPKEKKLEWGKGLAQKREAEARLQEFEVEKDKPFARTRDDPELDNMMKDRVRWGDPMAHLVKKKHSEPILPDLGDSEKMKESGFIVPQDIPSHSWLKRGLDAAPNRYGIKPGRHWDGVDRSNGFEKQMFKRTNEKRATEREAYLWSVSDM